MEIGNLKVNASWTLGIPTVLPSCVEGVGCLGVNCVLEELADYPVTFAARSFRKI